ncbi:MAG: decaprenyl-phosphate phosphoribosyltransferase [Candidatus Margulisiibacteriota bacterium]
MSALLKSLRPAQWTKNFFVFAGIIFSLNIFDTALLLKVICAFVIFCLLSSAIYLINDVRDVSGDRKHPQKKLRPIASGQLSIPAALVIALILLAIAVPASFYLDFSFALVALAYILLMVLYTFFLRDIVILDVFSIAAGFVLRAVAGVVVIGVELSPWLVICTILIALFIALGKRRHELITLTEAVGHRKILNEYNPQLLDQLISITAGATVVAYALYTLWPETVSKFNTVNLVYSIPFVLYGIFRYLYLIYKKEKGGRPEKILLTDLPLIFDIVLWIGSLFIIVYWFRS